MQDRITACVKPATEAMVTLVKGEITTPYTDFIVNEKDRFNVQSLGTKEQRGQIESDDC